MKHGIIIVLLSLLLSCTKSEKHERKAIDFAALSWPLFRGDAGLSGVAAGSMGKTFKLLWSFQTGDDIKASPVIGLGHVYVGSLDSKLYCLNAADGDSLWAFDLGDDVEAPALLLDSSVYVGSLGGDFVALDALTGAVRWRAKTDGEIYGSANWCLAPDGKRIIVGSYDFKMHCFDAASGEKRWEYETNNYINGAPATDGRVAIFGGCDERLHIVSTATGVKIGEVNAGSYIAGSAALVNGRAYLGHYGQKLICIDLDEQKILWEYDDGGKAGEFFSSPAVSEDRVVIGSRDRRVHCVRRKDGAKLWTFAARDDVDSSPVICGDKVVVGSSDGRLYVLALETGALLWNYEVGAAVGSPAVAGGLIIVGAQDGRVYAFGEAG